MAIVFENPPESARCERLRSVKTIAVVGLSPKPERPSHYVARSLQRYGFTIVPVRPAVERLLDERAYPSLGDIPFPVDLVNAFRAPDAAEALVTQCIALNIPALWMQEGMTNEAAARRAQGAGIWTVMDRCISRDYAACLAAFVR